MFGGVVMAENVSPLGGGVTSPPMPEIIEGEVDPSLKKKVKTLIVQKDAFFVYVDDGFEVQWAHRYADANEEVFGRILNRVAYLHGACRFIEDQAINLAMKCQIGEGLARYLETLTPENANQMLDIVEKQITDLNFRTSWSWYFVNAYGFTGICVGVFCFLWLFRGFAASVIGVTAFDVSLGGLIGAVGAIISIISRTNQIKLDANLGKTIHVNESLARVIVGVAGGLLASLAHKSGLLLANLSFNGSHTAFLLALAMIAGASERLVPNLIAKVENGATGK